jgi:hypothetical protein
VSLSDLFKDIIPSILQTKKDVLDVESDYNPYIIDRALSFHFDCVLQSNQMNLYPGLDKKLQYHYLLNSIRGYKRPFRPWQKRETIEDLEAVREHYNYSYEKAKEVLSLLTPEQIASIKNGLQKGGTDNGKQKRVSRKLR